MLSRRGRSICCLHLGETLQRRCGVDVSYLLLGGGAMRASYKAVARHGVGARRRNSRGHRHGAEPRHHAGDRQYVCRRARWFRSLSPPD